MNWTIAILSLIAIAVNSVRGQVQSRIGYKGDIKSRRAADSVSNVERRYPAQMEEYEVALSLLSNITFSTTRNYRSSSASNDCTSNDAECSSFSSCCQGGCSNSMKCICQANNEICFNADGNDSFCCSNKCGANGRCQCILEGASCTVGDGYCCEGLACHNETKTCLKDELMNSSTAPTSVPYFIMSTSTSSFNQSRNTVSRQPSSIPTNVNPANVTSNKTSASYCDSNNGACYNRGGFDSVCCSNQCDLNGTCIPLTKELPSLLTPTNEPTQGTHESTIKTLQPSATGIIFGNSCDDGQIKLSIEIETDRFGSDISWFIADSSDTKLSEVLNGTYGAFQRDKVDICVPPGMYNFTMSDEFGDGMCCSYGKGYVKLFINDREIIHVKTFGRNVTETLNAGFDPTMYMTDRHILYLEAHNVRRKDWHESNNVSYIPLMWSPQLAEEARVYAVKLLDACNTHGILHEHGVAEGENLAKNKGGSGWGQLYPPNKIVGRWVEWEIERNYPGNAHLTQAMWRASKYLGCGESMKPHKNGTCRVQVCRYARAGNCDMAKYNSTTGRNWLPPMLADTSKCGPNCPPEGCF